MKRCSRILKETALITALALSIAVLQAQNNFERKAPETFKEKILKPKEVKKTPLGVKTSMSRGNHIVPTEIINLEWGSTNWDTISKDVITYKPNTHLASEIIVKGYTGNNTFTNYSNRNIKTYDASENIIFDITEYWDNTNNTWNSFQKIVNEFDSQNNQTLDISMNWNNASSQWDTTEGRRVTNTYNINNDILTQITEYYYNFNDTWEITGKEMRDYDSNGHWISTIYQGFNGVTWENSSKEEYLVNASGEWTEVISYSWNGLAWVSDDKLIDVTWYNFADLAMSGSTSQALNGISYVNEEKFTGAYHTNGMPLLSLNEIWNGTGWENSHKMHFVYDSKDNVTEAMSQEWNGTNWVIDFWGVKAAYSYDNDDKILSYVEEDYNTDTETWENTDKYIYLYNTSVFSAGLDATICLGDSAHLNGSGGTTYNWSPTIGLSCSNCPNPKASPGVTTDYIVTVTNGTESGTDTIKVTVNSLPLAEAGSDEEICFGSNVYLSSGGGINYTWTPSAGLNNPNISNPLAGPDTTTTYTVTVTDENNCSDQEHITVTVKALPVVSFSGLESHYCTTDPSVTLSGAPSGGTFSGSGITNDQFNPSVAGDGAHTITYAFTDNNNCTNYSVQEVTVNTCSGIKPTSLITDLSMYPNPSKGIFTLELLQREPVDLAIQISNSLGQSVFSRSFNQHNGRLKEEVNLAGLQAGIYLLNIQSGADLINKKIIIE